MNTINLTAYEIFKNKIGDAEAKIVMEYIEHTSETKFNVKRETIASKQDVLDLHVDLKETKAEMIKWMFIFWVGQLAAMITFLKLLV